MINSILIILGFLLVSGLTIYLQAKIHVKYMVNAVDTEGNIFKECATKLINGEDIKNIKSLKKNIRLCKLFELLLLFIFIAIIIIIEIILEKHISNGLKLYKILSSIYCIYNILALFSNKYKKIIISKYLIIFTSLQTLKTKYGGNIKKIPFTLKLEIYNLADNNINLPTGKEDNNIITLSEYLKNLTKENNTRIKYGKEINKQEASNIKTENDEISLRVDHRGNITTYHGTGKRVGAIILEIEGRFTTTFTMQKDHGQISITSHQAKTLGQAKEILKKEYDIGTSFKMEGLEQKDDECDELILEESKKGEYTYYNGKGKWKCVNIVHGDGSEFFTTVVTLKNSKGQIELVSHLAENISQAKNIAKNLYEIGLLYEIPEP